MVKCPGLGFLIFTLKVPSFGFGKTSYLEPAIVSSIPEQSLKVTLSESLEEQLEELMIRTRNHLEPKPPVRDVSTVISGVVNPPGVQR